MSGSIRKSVLDRIANWLDRRELSRLRECLRNMEKEKRDFAPHLAYLESRDEMCSKMANIIARQGFEIEKLKGSYDRKAINQ